MKKKLLILSLALCFPALTSFTKATENKSKNALIPSIGESVEQIRTTKYIEYFTFKINTSSINKSKKTISLETKTKTELPMGFYNIKIYTVKSPSNLINPVKVFYNEHYDSFLGYGDNIATNKYELNIDDFDEIIEFCIHVRHSYGDGNGNGSSFYVNIANTLKTTSISLGYNQIFYEVETKKDYKIYRRFDEFTLSGYEKYNELPYYYNFILGHFKYNMNGALTIKKDSVHLGMIDPNRVLNALFNYMDYLLPEYFFIPLKANYITSSRDYTLSFQNKYYMNTATHFMSSVKSSYYTEEVKNIYFPYARYDYLYISNFCLLFKSIGKSNANLKYEFQIRMPKIFVNDSVEISTEFGKKLNDENFEERIL